MDKFWCSSHKAQFERFTDQHFLLLLSFLGTPFENPQRWMGQNTFPLLLLNDDNMIGEH